MKALVWEAARNMQMREQPVPTPAADEALIRVVYAGICGSELSGYLGHNALRVPPLVMGHEFAGEITALGAEAQQHNSALAVGQPVTVNPLDYTEPGDEFVQRGLHHLSPTRKLVGAHRPGAYAEYVAVPAKLISPLPEGLSLRNGALTEPVACGVRIGELAGDVAGQDCLIIGAGPIGLLALQALQLRGAGRIFIADLDAERLAMGAELGGEALNPRQVDVVQTVREASGGGVAVSIDAVGAGVTRTQCVSATKATGRMILSGLHEEVSEMPAADIIRREITVQGSFAYSPANFAQALELLHQNKIRLDPWITEAPLADGGQWFDRLIEAPGNVSKVLLKP